MSLRNFLLVTSGLATLFGLGFLLFPAWAIGIYGLATDEVGLLFVRYFGSAFAAFGLIAWHAKDITGSSSCSIIMKVMLYAGVIGTGLSIYGQTTGLVGSFGWVSVGLFVILTGGLINYIYINPEFT